MQNHATTARLCEHCGGPFIIQTWRLKHGRGKHCSRACADLAKLRPDAPYADRFWMKVDRNGPIPAHRPELGPCWLWTASRKRNGYGRFGIRGVIYLAHRVAYILTYGPIPPDMNVLHHCDVRPCCRPEHFFLGSLPDNNRDMVTKGRSALGERNGQAKITPAEAQNIRSRYTAGGIRQRDLADEFGLKQSTVSNIVQGKTWNHV